MKHNIKFIPYCICIIVICLIQTTTASSAETKFQLFPSNLDRMIECDYIKIKDNDVVCNDNQFVITYKIDKVKEVKWVDHSKVISVKQFTTDNIIKINLANSNKIENQRRKYISNNAPASKRTTPSLTQKYKHLFATSTLSITIAIIGLIIFLVGNMMYLVETFRVSILWGLSCIFLPLVAFIFLFVHWKVASKPFFLSLTGLGIILLSALVLPQTNFASYNTKNHQNSPKRYKCSGKIYCSEMLSCAEATFYLNNCQGTKIDGNNNGVPCEQQWCN